MKTVVITGSTRGLGWELAKNFRRHGFAVVVNGSSGKSAADAAERLLNEQGSGEVLGVGADVSDLGQVKALADAAMERFGRIDIWINNAGVNQRDLYAWELEDREIDFLLSVDLKGAMNGSLTALRLMEEQGFGAIYNVEGFGSNDAVRAKLAMYGTVKRAVTYFTDALAAEVKDKKLPVLVGKLSPGIMITDFLTSANGEQGSVELTDKVKKVYNILADKPEDIAEFLCEGMLKNRKNGAHIVWLTTAKSAARFMTSPFRKRDFFAEPKTEAEQEE